MREWLVAGALIESDARLLLVRNVRRGGREDWSTPGGVIDETDRTLLAGLVREVQEETGLTVRSWDGPVYEVVAEARDLGWRLRVEVHRALVYEGSLTVDDPDGIVTEAEFFDPARCVDLLGTMPPWVREPLGEWLAHRWDAAGARRYRYRVHGSDLGALEVVRAR